MDADIRVADEGTVFLFTILSERARQWVEENVNLEGWQWLGRESFAVDRRYAYPLAEGMQGDGLVLR